MVWMLPRNENIWKSWLYLGPPGSDNVSLWISEADALTFVIFKWEHVSYIGLFLFADKKIVQVVTISHISKVFCYQLWHFSYHQKELFFNKFLVVRNLHFEFSQARYLKSKGFLNNFVFPLNNGKIGPNILLV